MALYPNRSDLATQPAQVPKAKNYGNAKAQMDSQAVQPIAGAATPAGSGQPSPSSPLLGMEPGNIPTMSDPTAFPNQPITNGLPSGPGAGTSALKSASFGPFELSVMRALYLKHPNEDIRRLIEWTESNLG